MLGTSFFRKKPPLEPDGRLFVVSGASATGKSTFIRELLDDHKLRRRFAVPDGPVDELRANRVDVETISWSGPAILHFDILRSWRDPDYRYAKDPVFGLLGSATKVTVIVLANTPEVLRARMEARGKHDKYADTTFLTAKYRDWLDATAPYVGDETGHRFVLTEPGYPEIPDRAALFDIVAGRTL